MHCVVLAGGKTDPADPMYELTGDKPKSLIKFDDRTMLELVVDALQGADSIDDVFIVGVDESHDLHFSQPVTYVPDQGGMVNNALTGVGVMRERYPDAEYVLLSTADIPCVTSAHVDQYVESLGPLVASAYYTMVTQAAVEARFPGSKRTYTKLKEGPLAGADLMIARCDLADSNRELWDVIAAGRKQAWKVANYVGPLTVLKLLLGQLSTRDIEKLAEKILGQPARVVISECAEIAMDGDKPHQIEILRQSCAEMAAH